MLAVELGERVKQFVPGAAVVFPLEAQFIETADSLRFQRALGMALALAMHPVAQARVVRFENAAVTVLLPVGAETGEPGIPDWNERIVQHPIETEFIETPDALRLKPAPRPALALVTAPASQVQAVAIRDATMTLFAVERHQPRVEGIPLDRGLVFGTPVKSEFLEPLDLFGAQLVPLRALGQDPGIKRRGFAMARIGVTPLLLEGGQLGEALVPLSGDGVEDESRLGQTLAARRGQPARVEVLALALNPGLDLFAARMIGGRAPFAGLRFALECFGEEFFPRRDRSARRAGPPR